MCACVSTCGMYVFVEGRVRTPPGRESHVWEGGGEDDGNVSVRGQMRARRRCIKSDCMTVAKRATQDTI